jgi:hypothetical protein
MGMPQVALYPFSAMATQKQDGPLGVIFGVFGDA